MDYILHVIIIIASTLCNALGINLVFGKGKIFHFGSVAVSIAATYPMYLVVEATGSYMYGITAGLVGALLLSLFIALLALRLAPDGLGVLTIALHLTLLSVVATWISVTHGAGGITNVPRMFGLESIESFAVVSCVIAVVWFIIIFLIDRSPYGRKLEALAEQEWYASALGIRRATIYIVAFSLAAVGALLSNLISEQYFRLVHPSNFQYVFFIFYIAIIVAGKPGSVIGVTISTIALTILRESLRFLPLPITALGPLRLLLFGLILLIAVWWRRDTLFPVKRSV